MILTFLLLVNTIYYLINGNHLFKGFDNMYVDFWYIQAFEILSELLILAIFIAVLKI